MNHPRILQLKSKLLSYWQMGTKNTAMPGSFHDSSFLPTDADDDDERRHVAVKDDRDGKFTDFSMFLDLQNESLFWQSPGRLNPKAGDVIYIKDQSDRAIHDRVMLVLDKSQQSLKCLSFCLHWPPRLENHWFVFKPGERPDAGQVNKDNSIEIVFQPMPSSPPGGLTPKAGISINLCDLWNVEHISERISVAYLGQVKTASLQRLSLEVQKIFCDRLNKAIPQPPPVQEFVVHGKAKKTKKYQW